HLCAATRHLEQLVIGNLTNFFRVEDYARIACEHTIDVRKNLAGISVQRARQRNRGQVPGATAKRGRISLRCLALKTSHDHNVVLRQYLMNLLWTDVRDPRFGVMPVG